MADFKLTRRDGYICLALALITLAVYSRMAGAEFVILDDDLYVNSNPYIQSGLNWTSVKWALTSGYAANWHPLTWISHIIDCQLYGLNPSKHHQTNVVLHAASTVLLFILLRRLTGAFWRCAVVAALFAWHPLHVESVAWIAERKDVLSTFFWMLTLLAYVSYTRRRNAPSYALVLFLFVLALMSKPMVVTLPFVLLLLDFWPLGRVAEWQLGSAAAKSGDERGAGTLPLRELMVEKWPLFVLSAIGSLITYKVQSAGGMTGLLRVPFLTRAVNVLIAYCRYMGKIFWPAHLAAFYPYDKSPPAWQVFGALLVLAGVSFAAVKLWRRIPYLLFGWLFFLGTLVPAIGIVQVGQQSMADRYSYVPALGIFIAVVWGVAEFCSTRPNLTTPQFGVTVASLAGCLALTWRQEGFWQNYRAIFRHALAVTSNNAVAEYNVGYSYYLENNISEAMKYYLEAVRINPRYYLAQDGVGTCLAQQGKYTEATNYYGATVRLAPPYWKGHFNYGLSLEALGDAAGAISQFSEAARLEPDDAKPHFKLGQVLLSQNRFAEAKLELAEAARLKPDVSAIHSLLAAALKSLGEFDAAIEQYEIALRINPDDVMALNNLAWIRAANPRPELRNGVEAVRLAQHACDLTTNAEPVMLGTLAAAYAEAGEFQEAVTTAQKARELALARGLKAVRARNEELLTLYQAGKPFHEAAPATENKPRTSLQNVP